MAERPVPVPKLSNPAVVGLAGFGGTTLLLQFNNLGWCGPGVVLWMALFFGGLAQIVAGLQEFKTGNNFGFCAFSTYGAFWLTIGGILLGKNFGILNITTSDIGWTLVVFTLITIILFFGAMRQNGVLALVFLTLALGYIMLDIGHLGGPAVWIKIAAVDLIICALSAWYLMAHVIFADMKVNLPVGKAWMK
jgi:succinate-acetate transporter protein